MTDGPLLSVVVRVVGGGVYLERCLESLTRQSAGRPIEILVPHDSAVRGVANLARRFPDVHFLDMGLVTGSGPCPRPLEAHELYDRRTATGLEAARGSICALVEDFGVPAPDWCDQVIEAHVLPHAAIGGAVEHRGHGVLNWAAYFMDFGRFQLPLAEGLAHFLTDVNVSYKHSALDAIRGAWVGSYNEVTVHAALARRGAVLWRRPRMVVLQDRGRLRLLSLIAERFAWGRLYGRVRTRGMLPVVRAVYVIGSPGIPFVVFIRMLSNVLRSRRHRVEFMLAFPALLVLLVAWGVGEVVGYLEGPGRGQPSAAEQGPVTGWQGSEQQPVDERGRSTSLQPDVEITPASP